MKQHYDVIIVGAGPAGIFAARELIRAGDRSVLIIEKGRDINDRTCPMQDAGVPCLRCEQCGILSGWGGAGAYSDGKLTLSAAVGGWLGEYLPEQELVDLIASVDAAYQQHGAAQEVHGEDREATRRLRARAASYDLELVHSPIRHIGTNLCREVLRDFRSSLEGRVDLLFNTPVAQVLAERGSAAGAATRDGTIYKAPIVILAAGREGAAWLGGEARRLGLSLRANPVDIGVRVELPAAILQEITDITYEAKFRYVTRRFRDRVRTFCMNPFGEVVQECSSGVTSVNGHSYHERRTGNTNFALLVNTDFTEPFHEPIAYGRYVAGLANLLGKGVLVQRLGDLKMGRRSTPRRIAEGSVRPTLKEATPGDLSFALPYRHLTAVLEMLEALDNIAPGVNSGDTLLYGAEVKYYSQRLKLTGNLETEIRNLFAVGDGAGVTRGLIQASVSGVVAGREAARRK
jgi:uncharacterized FAD-dependent dehydrogenase